MAFYESATAAANGGKVESPRELLVQLAVPRQFLSAPREILNVVGHLDGCVDERADGCLQHLKRARAESASRGTGEGRVRQALRTCARAGPVARESTAASP